MTPPTPTHQLKAEKRKVSFFVRNFGEHFPNGCGPPDCVVRDQTNMAWKKERKKEKKFCFRDILWYEFLTTPTAAFTSTLNLYIYFWRTKNCSFFSPWFGPSYSCDTVGLGHFLETLLFNPLTMGVCVYIAIVGFHFSSFYIFVSTLFSFLFHPHHHHQL